MSARENRIETLYFEALFESVTHYVTAINRSHQIIMANDLFTNRFGTSPDGFCYKAWKGRDRPCEVCLVMETFQDGQPRSREEEVVSKDGSRQVLRMSSTPVRDDRGKIAYVVETGIDVDEEMRLHHCSRDGTGTVQDTFLERLKFLQTSEEKYRTIFERSQDAILLTDVRGNITEMNGAGLLLFGYENHRGVPIRGSAQVLFEDPLRLLAFQRVITRQGFIRDFETRLKKTDGTVFDALTAGNVIVNSEQKITGYAIIIRDITRTKQALKEIEIQNKRLTTLNLISLTTNSSLELDQVLETTIDQMMDIAKPDSVRIYLLDEKHECLCLAAHRGLSARFVEGGSVRRRKVGEGILGQTALTGQTRIVESLTRSDHPFVAPMVEEGLQATAYLPLTSKGTIVGVMCVSSHSALEFSTDYVEFLGAIGNQIGVAIHNAELYQELKKSYEELKQAHEQILCTEKLASLGKLSATIAHEINNPIAAVLTYIRLMMKLLDRGHSLEDRQTDVARYLGVMASEMTRCGDIVKNLLAFSRQTRPDVKPHSLSEILDRSLALLGHSLELRQIHVAREIADDLPLVECDFRQMEQAFLNLISNASEAMEQGGILTVAVSSPKPGWVEIQFFDTGCGIPERHLKDVFEPFFTTKDEAKGVGLGLSVVYGIITKHGGAIDVKSLEGKGTTFRILLPTRMKEQILCVEEP